jgi:YHS domain-containing protein
MTLVHRIGFGGILACVAAVGMMSASALADCAGACCAEPALLSAQAAAAGDPYTLSSDPVTGQALGNTPVIIQHEGRELRFANKANADKFGQDPKTYLAKADEAMVKDQLPRYPLDTCPVSGDKLGGDMGQPVNIIYNNRLVRLCCADCQKELTAKPAEFIKKLDAAVVAKQKAGYKLQTCPVSGEKLGGMGEPVDYVIANRLVRLCCSECIGKIQKDPMIYLQRVDAGAAGSAGQPAH